MAMQASAARDVKTNQPVNNVKVANSTVASIEIMQDKDFLDRFHAPQQFADWR